MASVTSHVQLIPPGKVAISPFWMVTGVPLVGVTVTLPEINKHVSVSPYDQGNFETPQPQVGYERHRSLAMSSSLAWEITLISFVEVDIVTCVELRANDVGFAIANERR